MKDQDEKIRNGKHRLQLSMFIIVCSEMDESQCHLLKNYFEKIKSSELTQ